MSCINEQALQSFLDGIKIGLSAETENKVFERTFPEVKHISSKSSREERVLAFAPLRKRLGLRPIALKNSC